MDLTQRLLYRDGLILALDKPAGLAVHPGPGGGENLERYLDDLRFGLRAKPQLAHRLDRDTSGCLILGRHPKALRKLGKLFSEGRVEKRYWAVVHGAPPTPSGVIDAALTKRSSARQKRWWMEVDPAQGKSARTLYRVMGQAAGISWLELTPKTGRTHQIRVHCAHIGCPLVGDPQYGAPKTDDPHAGAPLHLLARAIRLPLSANKPPIAIVAEPPPHMLDALRACGFEPGADYPPFEQSDADGGQAT
ncbi:RluA family pseudouridine synthase [Magnetofaba australis]|uniref:RluA family pseudouridine synthase n=1 Tax=Magnetofaba australis TaxID=1472297 RepID=UPI000A19D764|nr:RNA pseudouridine synthase [Magnetofaba australis]